MSSFRLPKTLLSRAESLSKIGVHELAWRLEDASRVIELLQGRSVAVLGGDVYIRRTGRFEPAYESWYAEPEPQESPTSFAERCCAIACDYLVQLGQKGTMERWVTLVLSEPIEPSED